MCLAIKYHLNMAFVSGPALPSARHLSSSISARRNAYMCDAGKKPEAGGSGAATGVSPAKWVPLKKVKSAGKELWNNTYVDIFGSRGGGSVPEYDLRPKSLRGEEGAVCPACNGTNIMTCSICYGYEHYVDGEAVECPGCKGKFEIPCSLCGGSGKQIELTDNAWFEKGIRNLLKK